MLLLLLSCSTRCDDVVDAVDYADEDNWICLPGRDDTCAADLLAQEVLADGSLVDLDISIAVDPSYDCFYIYPTVDLRTRPAVHEDLTDLDEELDATLSQALWLRQHCRVYVPAYRQATYGNYFKREAVREPCFDRAYQDAQAAWERYLEVYNQGRPVVLYGHSQGGQVTSRLFREREDAEVVAVYPIGWPVDAGLQCSDDDETGCMVSYKSYLDDDDIPASGAYAEGDEVACVDPSHEGLLSSVFLLQSEDVIPEGMDAPVDSYLVYRDAYTAECQGSGDAVGLEIGWAGEDERDNPVPWDLRAIRGSNGAHVLDVPWALVDLGEDMDRRVEAFSAL